MPDTSFRKVSVFYSLPLTNGLSEAMQNRIKNIPPKAPRKITAPELPNLLN